MKRLISSALIVVALSFSTPVFSQVVNARLKSDFKKGEIDVVTYLRHVADAYAKPETMPLKYQGEVGNKQLICADVMEYGSLAALNWNILPESLKKDYGFVKYRPTTSQFSLFGSLRQDDIDIADDELNPDSSNGTYTQKRNTFSSTHFTIHWETANDDSEITNSPPLDDDDNNGIPDSIEMASGFFESAYAYFISRGYTALPSDNSDGTPENPDNLIDVYFSLSSHGA